MPRIVHFEFPADDPERASEFYSSIFGWQFQKWDGSGPVDYWLVKTGEGEPGIDGGMMRRPSADYSTTNTIGVESLDETVTKVEKAGGKVVMPRMAVPGIGYLAYCTDTEGNVFGLMQPDSSAA